ncbi:5-(carboxyamino)imidazole ribonucleotide mutase [Haliea sp. E1-2-M8]|uniref:5-(carboxyamino)imidazole ribonucleotide mutase n=1 Tax=Haliea sp. E1-2-M8 TaxID=3064706 RepID=UPI00271BDF73|nr:5-(carboxyamino)imidazole ribonucleotide mutase [Haliea sp. E1-2-M8]MDO8860070.1 5-(carboxyamino)imidazole ribonucleotide mutase [Haliea sp. E1-2-M8]
MSKPFVAIVMGSDSDLPVMEASFAVLRSFGIPFEARITSAHRTPEVTKAFIKDAEARGCAVFIAAAGMAAHLAGAVSATTVKPVIGVPMNSSLDGLDALLSTVQMPAGIPVASVAIGKAGAKNAAYLAAQILAVADPDLERRLREERAANAEAIRVKDEALQESLRS